MPHKLALMIHALRGGGAERLMSQLAARWEAAHEVHLITWSAVDDDQYFLPQAVIRHGLDLQQPSSSAWQGVQANWTRVRRLRHLLRTIGPDFMLSFSDQMNIVALEASRNLGPPMWIAEHSDPAKQRLSRMWEAWRSRSYPRCAGCVVLTAEIANTMLRWIPSHRLHVIPPAIAPPDHPPPPRSLQTGQRSFLYVGRLSHEKGVDILLRAWSQLAATLPEWQLRIIGDGPQREQLQGLANAQRIPRVVFHGWLADPWPQYQSADCFVLPSRYEGFPLALLEAMSQRTAAIATRCTSAMDALSSDPACLLLVATESVEELASAMRSMAMDGQLRQELGEQAGRVAARYTWSSIGPLWDALLATL